MSAEGITPETLAASLAKMHIFPRLEGVPDPVVLLDEHSSRFFQPPFLKDIVDKLHPWEVNPGLPNRTHICQASDSMQQNESFKRELILAKRGLVQEKQRLPNWTHICQVSDSKQQNE